jgi:adenine phosphoribosyltransferase
LAGEYLQLIDKSGVGRYDVTPIFANATAFSALLDDALAACADLAFDLVAGIDALGFVFGAGLAARSGKGFLPVRKGGKLPVPIDRMEFVDYTGERKSLEVRRDAITPGQRALLADEWIETGAQAAAAIALIERQGGVIAGIVTLHMDECQRTRNLSSRYPIRQLWPEGE